MSLEDQIKELEIESLSYPRMRTADVIRILKHLKEKHDKNIKAAYDEGFQHGASSALNQLGSLL